MKCQLIFVKYCHSLLAIFEIRLGLRILWKFCSQFQILPRESNTRKKLLQLVEYILFSKETIVKRNNNSEISDNFCKILSLFINHFWDSFRITNFVKILLSIPNSSSRK